MIHPTFNQNNVARWHLGADDWMGSNADGTGAPGADGPRVHLDVPHPKEK